MPKKLNFSHKIGNKSMNCKKNKITPVLIGGFVEMDNFCIYPYWFEGQGGILEQEVCSTTPVRIKS